MHLTSAASEFIAALKRCMYRLVWKCQTFGTLMRSHIMVFFFRVERATELPIESVLNAEHRVSSCHSGTRALPICERKDTQQRHHDLERLEDVHSVYN